MGKTAIRAIARIAAEVPDDNLRIVQTLRGVPAKNIREVLQFVRLDGQRGKKVAHDSLGIKQRPGLAAALLGYPKLLILDEPTNGLDPAGIQEMRELICDLPGRFGMTVVVSSHLLSEIDQMADQLTRFLAESRLGVVRLEERQKSLEDIFLELTGKTASL